MPGASALSFRAAPDLVDELDALSEATDRPRSWHLEQALSAYLETQTWQIARIRQGMAELKSAKGISHDDVAGWLRSWGTSEEKPPPYSTK